MDVINMISKTPGLPDAAPDPHNAYANGSEYFCVRSKRACIVYAYKGASAIL